ncbi:MAG: hypothetical protein FWD05_05740 [Oscillospiraceae bacterium]|nr:hypothetical protein [Oscillospiraceae bacterium]
MPGCMLWDGIRLPITSDIAVPSKPNTGEIASIVMRVIESAVPDNRGKKRNNKNQKLSFSWFRFLSVCA